MRMERRARIELRIQSVAITCGVLLALALLAWLSTRYAWTGDWSDRRHGAVAEATVELLQRLDAPLEAIAFVAPDDVLYRHVERLLQGYRRHAPAFEYRLINPDARPDLVREFGIQSSGEIILRYRGRQERVQAPSEPRISAAILRLHQSLERPLLYFTGHGERSLQGEANHDLGSFGAYLRDRGYRLQALRPGSAEMLPADAALLVIAGPRTEWLPGTREMVIAYLQRGGNLLWLLDESDRTRLGFLLEYLGLDLLPGTVIEPRAEQLLGVNDPRFLVTDDYAGHPALRRVRGLSLLVAAQALIVSDVQHDWVAEPLLRSEARHWNETGDLERPRFAPEAGEQRGPLTLGLSLRRQRDGGGEQRIAVIGNAEWLSNAYLGNGANLQAGVSLVDWLAQADLAGLIADRAAPDQRLELTQPWLIAMGLGLLVLLPGSAFGVAGLLWWRRRYR